MRRIWLTPGHTSFPTRLKLTGQSWRTRRLDDPDWVGQARRIDSEIRIGRAIAKVQPPGLEVVQARGRVRLSVAGVGIGAVLAAGHPGFHVHHRGVLDPEVARAALDDAVREVEPLEDLLAVAEH